MHTLDSNVNKKTQGFGQGDTRQNGGVVSIASNKSTGTYSEKGRKSADM